MSILTPKQILIESIILDLEAASAKLTLLSRLEIIPDEPNEPDELQILLDTLIDLFTELSIDINIETEREHE